VHFGVFRILKINERTSIPPNYMGSGVGLLPQDPEERGNPWVKGHQNYRLIKIVTCSLGLNCMLFTDGRTLEIQ